MHQRLQDTGFFECQAKPKSVYRAVQFSSPVLDAFLAQCEGKNPAEFRTTLGQVMRLLQTVGKVPLLSWVTDDLFLLKLADKRLVTEVAAAMNNPRITKWSASTKFAKLCQLKKMVTEFLDWVKIKTGEVHVIEEVEMNFCKWDRSGNTEWYNVEVVGHMCSIAKTQLKTSFKAAVHPVNKGERPRKCSSAIARRQTAPDVCVTCLLASPCTARKTTKLNNQLLFKQKLENGMLMLPVECRAIYKAAAEHFMSMVALVREDFVERLEEHRALLGRLRPDVHDPMFYFSHHAVCGMSLDEFKRSSVAVPRLFVCRRLPRTHISPACRVDIQPAEQADNGLDKRQWAFLKSSLQTMGMMACAGNRGELLMSIRWGTLAGATLIDDQPFFTVSTEPVMTAQIPKTKEKIERGRHARLPWTLIAAMKLFALLTAARPTILHDVVAAEMDPDMICTCWFFLYFAFFL